MPNPSTSHHADAFSEASFWQKLASAAGRAGRELILLALKLFYTWRADSTPLWAKATIVAALGYFISPLDLVPDVIPVVGYSDDLGVLLGALQSVDAYLTPELEAQAKATLQAWFG